MVKKNVGIFAILIALGFTLILMELMVMGIKNIYAMMMTTKDSFIYHFNWNYVSNIIILSSGIGGLLFFIKKMEIVDAQYCRYMFRTLWLIIAASVLTVISTIVIFIQVVFHDPEALQSIPIISNLVVICIVYGCIGLGLYKLIDMFFPQENKPTQEEKEEAVNRFRRISEDELNKQAKIYYGKINEFISNMYKKGVAQNEEKIIDLVNGIVEDLFNNLSSVEKNMIIQTVEGRTNMVIIEYCEELILEYFNQDKNKEKISQIIEAMIEGRLEESIAKKSQIKNSISKGK